jgi:hypothetical protein
VADAQGVDSQEREAKSEDNGSRRRRQQGQIDRPIEKLRKMTRICGLRPCCGAVRIERFALRIIPQVAASGVGSAGRQAVSADSLTAIVAV